MSDDKILFLQQLFVFVTPDRAISAMSRMSTINVLLASSVLVAIAKTATAIAIVMAWEIVITHLYNLYVDKLIIVILFDFLVQFS